MKTVNTFAACGFGIIGAIAAVVAFAVQRWEYGVIAGICFAVCYIAIQDIKDEQKQ